MCHFFMCVDPAVVVLPSLKPAQRPHVYFDERRKNLTSLKKEILHKTPEKLHLLFQTTAKIQPERSVSSSNSITQSLYASQQIKAHLLYTFLLATPSMLAQIHFIFHENTVARLSCIIDRSNGI